MPLKGYGVLKGTVVEAKRETEEDSPHYQIHIKADTTDYRIAVNVKSAQKPPNLLYVVKENFRHVFLTKLPGLPVGYTPVKSAPNGIALDYIRGNLFQRKEMKILPPNLPGEDNDLSDRIEHYIMRAKKEQKAQVYAFGVRWGPEKNLKDKVFHFLPGNGIHDIHMNQGNTGSFAKDNGVWQDGGLLIHFAQPEQWVALFLAFQSQTWHTLESAGDRIPELLPVGPAYEPALSEPDYIVQIVGALVNPGGANQLQETVTLLNTSPRGIDLDGWAILDKEENTQVLSGVIGAGATLQVKLEPEVQLGSRGGLITLVNKDGLKVHGVSYTEEQARRKGWTIVF